MATCNHFVRAALEIGAHGDNDTVPFDIDTQFIAQNHSKIGGLAYDFFQQLTNDSVKNSRLKILELNVFNERLLTPAGHTGFRITTKLHPFWSVYFNGLAIGIAEELEPRRDPKARSYRYLNNDDVELFDRSSSWKSFREDSANAAKKREDAIVVQTDISSFYESISHHHIQNLIDDLFPERKIGNQVVALLSRFSNGRSFGLPVGGQGSRILAELFLNAVDDHLTTKGLDWLRYVDDYVLFCNSHAEAYASLSILSHALANYGLTLNKTKTIILTSKHFGDYVDTQIGGDADDASKLREIDLFFDPYSDAPIADYDSLKSTVENLHVQKLLNRELEKSIPDTFLVAQVTRTLRLHEPKVAVQLVTTLLGKGNLHAFRASWSTIMGGVSKLRGSADFSLIHPAIDVLLDAIPDHSSHLLMVETNLLHYLRTIRFKRTNRRAAFVQKVFDSIQSDTLQRACIDCWRLWKDRAAFTHLRSRWGSISAECQRMIWLSSFSFGDEGDALRRQFLASLQHSWRLGIERKSAASFAALYQDWCSGFLDEE